MSFYPTGLLPVRWSTEFLFQIGYPDDVEEIHIIS